MDKSVHEKSPKSVHDNSPFEYVHEKGPAVGPSTWPSLHKVRPELSVVSKWLFSKVESKSARL